MENMITLQTLFDEIVELQKIIKESVAREKSSKSISHPICSSSLNELGAALAKAQADMAIAGLSSQNAYLKSRYSDLTDVVKASRQALAKNGLSVLQILNESSEGFVLITRLQHISDQYVESRVRIIPEKDTKNTIHSFASQLTYMKRYSYASLVGVVSGDEDDDGETAVAESRDLFARGTALNTKYNQQDKSRLTIGPKQLEELERELTDYPDIAKMILDGFHLRSLADLPDEKYFPSLDRIREIKKIRTGT